MLCTKITRLLSVVSFLFIFVTAPVMSSGELLDSPARETLVESVTGHHDTVTGHHDIGFLRQKSSGWFPWLPSRIKNLFPSNNQECNVVPLDIEINSNEAFPSRTISYTDEILFDKNVSVDQRLKGLIDLNKKLDEDYPVISIDNKIALRLHILAALVDMFNHSAESQESLKARISQEIDAVEKDFHLESRQKYLRSNVDQSEPSREDKQDYGKSQHSQQKLIVKQPLIKRVFRTIFPSVLEEQVARVKDMRERNREALAVDFVSFVPKKAFFRSPKTLNYPHLLFARSLRQPNGWVCGPMALYTAHKVNDWLKDGFSEKKSDCFLDYAHYNFDDFSSWYSRHIANSDHNVYYSKLGVEPLGNLLCPQPDITQNQGANLLNSEQIEPVAQKLFGPNGYILLSSQALDGSGPLFVENTAAQGIYSHNDGLLPIEKSDKYLRSEAKAFFGDADRRGLYLFYNVESHWVLVVVAKTGQSEAKMVVFDSLNRLSDDEGVPSACMSIPSEDVIKKLYHIFFQSKILYC